VRNVLTIMKRELAAYFVSPMAYVIMTLFLFIVGWFFFRGLVMVYSFYSMQSMQNPMMAGQINIHDIVVRNFYSNFAVLMMFVAPFLSMRILAEERKQGTAELLLTLPITTGQLVLGKYLGVLAFGGLILALTFQYPLYLSLMGAAPPWGPLAAVYLGSLLVVGAFLAIGLVASSLTSNQIIAAVTTFIVCLMFWMIGFLGEMGGGGGEYSGLVKALSINNHLEDFLKGVIDSGSVAFFLVFIGFALFVTQRVVDSSRWR
jgi:ABC-2 type transport system permease protein